MKIVIVLVCMLLCGCQRMNQKVDEKMNQVQQDVDKVKDEVVKTSQKTMDDLMDHFEEQKVEFDDLKDVEKTSFPYHDGKSFMIDDTYAYLYHLDLSDQSMNDLLQKAKQDGMLEISINDEMKTYQAIVNGEFLLLYDQKADAQQIADVFKTY